ncbi:MAG: hypothetical protein DI564_13065 [Rhodanobacter denitrificans]|uniref:DUF2141 domain-containing protein n=1 Tax=Rhodanobacter denitrificans TaxID=666685 RepID=A0A2W5M592_9GAMM|nr:MAG: hypothetical protein DI564_13065 [Rhodanobacter denitrificans]
MITRTVLAALLFVAAGTVAAADLTVEVADIRVQAGQLKLAVVGSAEGWDGKAKPVAGEATTPTGATATFRFKDLPPGTYAVQVMHDENGNGKLDTNFVGMPIEGYGFSNNPRVMRKPTWDEARFELGADGTTVAVQLR